MKMVRTRYKMRPDQRKWLNLQADLERARKEEESRPKVGPKEPPVVLPEKPNEDGY